MKRLYDVVDVSISIAKSLPPKLIIHVAGHAASSGWKNPQIAPWFYVVAPADGVMDFDFIADPPTGISLPVVSAISATEIFDRDPSHFWGKGKPLKGIRIHASTNVKEIALTSASPLALSGDDDPFPVFLAPQSLNLETEEIPQGALAELVGKSLRVYKTGDMLTMDYRPDRANIELNPRSLVIVRIWFG